MSLPPGKEDVVLLWKECCLSYSTWPGNPRRQKVVPDYIKKYPLIVLMLPLLCYVRRDAVHLYLPLVILIFYIL